MIIDLISVIFLVAGALFILIASIGLLRMPDIYIRLHATTKSASLGILLIFAGTALAFGSLALWIKAVISVVFIFITVPIATHVIGRVAHSMGIPQWHKTSKDDLQEDELKDASKQPHQKE